MKHDEGVAPVLLKSVVCDMCGMTFAIPAALYDRLVAFRGTVCCPSGHVRLLGAAPPHERRIAQLEELVDAQQDRLVLVQQENAKLRQTVVDRLVGPETAPDAAP